MEDEALRNFLEKLRDRSESPFLLTAVFYLLQPSVSEILGSRLHTFLRELMHATKRHPTISRGAPKGRIRWSQTLQKRATRHLDKVSFAVEQPARSADVPENQLLKLFLWHTVNLCRRIEGAVGQGTLPQRVSMLRAQAEQALKNPIVRNVTLPGASAPLMHRRAKRHRLPEYSVVSRLVRCYEGVFQFSKWHTLVALISQGWLSPISDDELLELYSLVLVLDILEKDLGYGPPLAVDILRAGRKEIALFKHSDGGAAVKVFFDQGPRAALDHSGRYGEMLKKYRGVAGSDHRPDILIHRTQSNGDTRILAIEMKRSVDDRYQRDSIYKVFGYRHDFALMWPPEQTLKLVLIFPQGIEAIADVTGDDVALASSLDRDAIKKMMLAALS